MYLCLDCAADKTGYLIGSIEGRVAVHHVEDANSAKNFTFKCHRCVLTCVLWEGGHPRMLGKHLASTAGREFCL